MHIHKIAVSLIITGYLAIPAIAVAADPSTMSPEAQAAANKAINSVPSNPDGTYDVSTIRITKHDYMDQLGKSFDKMDFNHDGVIDGQEMLDAQTAAKGHIDSLEDAPPYSLRGRPAAAPAGGVQPLNAKDLLK